MTKDALHQLIHSLSVSEKGNYIKSKGEGHLTTLFNAINKLETYDKAVLEKRLSKHPELIKHLSKYKNNVYGDIMRVMRSFREEKGPSVDTRLRVYLMDITFLMERGLFESAMKLLKDAKKLAVEYEKYTVILEIIQYEIDLSQRLYDKDSSEITQTLIEEEEEIAIRLNNQRKYRALAYQLKFVYERNGNTNEEQLQEANELMNNELLVNEERAISFISQYKYCYIYSLYHYMKNDLEVSYSYQKKGLDCWEKYPHQKQVDLLSYLKDVYNYLNTSVKLKQYAAFEQLLEKVKKEVKPESPYEEATAFVRLYYPESFYYLRRADFEKLGALIDEIQPMLKKHSGSMKGNDIYTFKMSINTLLFIMDRHEEAYKGYSEIIKQKFSTRIDFQCVAWLFKLIIAFEHEYEDWDNLYRAAKRFFNKIKTEEIEEAYQLVMEFLYRVNKSPSSEMKALYIEYQLPLQKLKDNNRHIVSLSEMLIWLEHMISQKSQMDIYKEQAVAAGRQSK